GQVKRASGPEFSTRSFDEQLKPQGPTSSLLFGCGSNLNRYRLQETRHGSAVYRQLSAGLLQHPRRPPPYCNESCRERRYERHAAADRSPRGHKFWSRIGGGLPAFCCGGIFPRDRRLFSRIGGVGSGLLQTTRHLKRLDSLLGSGQERPRVGETEALGERRDRPDPVDAEETHCLAQTVPGQQVPDRHIQIEEQRLDLARGLRPVLVERVD